MPAYCFQLNRVDVHLLGCGDTMDDRCWMSFLPARPSPLKCYLTHFFSLTGLGSPGTPTREQNKQAVPSMTDLETKVKSSPQIKRVVPLDRHRHQSFCGY